MSVTYIDNIPLSHDYYRGDILHLWLKGDIHYGKGECDYQLLDNYHQWFDDNKDVVKTAWFGDMGEFAIPIHLPYTTVTQVITTFDQWLDIIEERLIIEKPFFYIAGNHENRILKNAFAYDPIKRLCDNNNVRYYDRAGFWIFTINDREYVWYVEHGKTNTQNPEAYFRALRRFGTIRSCDFVARGHSHQNFIGGEDTLWYNNRTRKLELKRQQWIIIGSMLTYPRYASQGKLRPYRSGNVIVTFEGNKQPKIYHGLDEWTIDWG